MSIQKFHIVPTLLISCNNGEIILAYDIQTYVYATLFDNVRFTSITDNGNNDLIHVWRDILVQLQNKLCKQGLVDTKQLQISLL